MAVALGCTFFEKHLTLNKTDNGPDHAASLDPLEFQEYVKSIKEAGQAMGTANAGRSIREEQMASVSRKSIHYKINLTKGSKLKDEDLILLRPGDGILWDSKNAFIGNILKRNVNSREQLSPEDFV
jgi:sialic acid synthase SpsE